MSIKITGLTLLISGALAFFCCSPSCSAATLNTSDLGIFPKQMSDLAYVDLKSGRSFPWFAQLEQQLLPVKFRQFEDFLASAGFDAHTQIHELCWGSVDLPEHGDSQTVGLALGDFDPAALEGQFQQEKVPSIELHGATLYAFGSGSGDNDILFTFIDANTAAFGERDALAALLDVHTGAAEGLLANDALLPLVTEASSNSGILWAVLDSRYAHMAMDQLVPRSAALPEAEMILTRTRGILIGVNADDDGIQVNFQVICGGPDDANLLSAALQAGFMYRSYQSSSENPPLAAVLDQARVAPNGDRLTVNFSVAQDQLLALLSSHAFIP